MKEIIQFEDWAKLDFRIGEVISITKKGTEIIVGDKNFFTKLSLVVKKGDKIVVLLSQDNLIIPFAGNSFLVPDSDIEPGSRIS